MRVVTEEVMEPKIKRSINGGRGSKEGQNSKMVAGHRRKEEKGEVATVGMPKGS